MSVRRFSGKIMSIEKLHKQKKKTIEVTVIKLYRWQQLQMHTTTYELK